VDGGAADPDHLRALARAAGVPGRGAEDQGPPGEPRRVGYAYVLPALLVYCGFVIFPLVHSFWLSFFSWDGFTPKHWIGLTNYRDVVSQPELRSAFLHSFILIIFYALLPVIIGLGVATIAVRTRLRGEGFMRSLLFMPQVVPTVAVAIAWRWIYASDGPLNNSLRTGGFGALARPWLGDFNWALVSIGLIGTWASYGLCTILFVAGIQKIPSSLYDSARVEGAGPLREFLVVTLPGLRGELAVAMTLTVVSALRGFDLVFVTTQGGPGNATLVPGVEVYKQAFQYGNVGLAAAVGISLAAVTFLVTILITRLEGRKIT
jgi:raffinose/stachyose/melibiose transport system permease protein